MDCDQYVLLFSDSRQYQAWKAVKATFRFWPTLWISGGQIESRAESDAVVRAMGSELYGSVGKGSRPELHQPPRYVWSARPLPSAPPPRSEASSAHPGSDYEFRSKFFSSLMLNSEFTASKMQTLVSVSEYKSND